MSKSARRNLVFAMLAAALAGCVEPAPMLEEHFGDAVRAARDQQILNPEAGRTVEPVAGLDGPAAREAVGRYQDSFKAPPPVTNVINIGGTIAGGNSR